MAKNLTNNISTQYIDAINKLKSKKSKQRVVAYVESYDDVLFWRNILDCFENDFRYFEIMLPSHNDLTKGKKRVLANLNQENIGTNMIACVDADYDYLLQNTTTTSYIINNNPFVLHTYTYAIENLQCYAPILHKLCVMATLNDRKVFDFENFLTTYSEIIFELFVWNIWFYRNKLHKCFSMSKFNDFIHIENINIYSTKKQLLLLKEKINTQICYFEQQYANAIEEINLLKKEITKLGTTPQTTYLYIQGHFLLDSIVLPLMKQVCATLTIEREREIMRNAIHKKQCDNELQGYKHSVEDICSIIKKHNSYNECVIVQKIYEDVIKLLKNNTSCVL